MIRSFPTPRRDIEHQSQLNYARNLRTHHSELSLLMVKKVDALEHLEQLWHEARSIRAWSGDEQFDSPAWREYSAAVKVLKGINREEETLWQALLAFRRESNSTGVVTSTTKSADGRAQEATASHYAVTDGYNGAQLSSTSPNRSHSNDGDLNVQCAAQAPTEPEKCSDADVTDKPATNNPPLKPVQIKGHCPVMNQLATSNTNDQPDLCTIPPVALKPSSLVQGLVSHLCTADRISRQGTSVVRMLHLWCGVGLLALNHLLGVDWFSPVRIVTRIDVAVFVVFELILHAYLCGCSVPWKKVDWKLLVS